MSKLTEKQNVVKAHNIDDNSRDYNLKDIEADERFTQTTKEFFITMVVYIAFAALMIGNLLLLNGNKSLVLGFPLWISHQMVSSIRQKKRRISKWISIQQKDL